MGLMTGSGPLGRKPAGKFNFDPPEPGRALYLEPTPKRIRVVLAGETIADTRRASIRHESRHQPAYHFPPSDVLATLEPSDTITRCPYKGKARYYSVGAEKDLVWHYDEPFDEVRKIAGLVCFFNERVDLELDCELQERPESPWSHGVKSEA